VRYVRSNWAREDPVVARVLGPVVLVLRLADATGGALLRSIPEAGLPHGGTVPGGWPGAAASHC
jgi:hypothetical protein